MLNLKDIFFRIYIYNSKNNFNLIRFDCDKTCSEFDHRAPKGNWSLNEHFLGSELFYTFHDTTTIVKVT